MDQLIEWLIGSFFSVMSMVFNATFNNISAISWRSALLVEETKTTNMSQTLLHNVVSRTPHHQRDSNSQR